MATMLTVAEDEEEVMAIKSQYSTEMTTTMKVTKAQNGGGGGMSATVEEKKEAECAERS